MKHMLKLMATKNIKEVKEVVISIRDTNLTHDYFKKLSESMPRRLQLCCSERAI